MRKGSNKPKVLFIASNIPTPKRKSNKVVMTIAHKLSAWFDITVMHPAEYAPFPIYLMKKYRKIAGRQSWNDGNIQVLPFKYIRLFGNKNAFRLLPYYEKRIKRHIERFGMPELVHAHFALPDGYLAYLINKAYHIPYIISFRKTDISFLCISKECSAKKMMYDVLSHAKYIVVHNSAQQEALSNAGFESILMAHGIEESFFKQKGSLNSTNNLVIATIGELIPQKHIDWVINAVKNYNGDKKITLKIAGDGIMHQEYEALSQGHDNIIFLGQINHDKIGELLLLSDIFALPSVNETFGLVYLEAAAHQNAVIATKGTGIWGHFSDGEEALYCDSYTSFQNMLYKLIDDDDYRNQMAREAYQKTWENYTWGKIISQYLELYDI